MATKPVFTDGMPGAEIRKGLNDWASYVADVAMPAESATSLVVGNGSKVLTAPEGRAYGIGQALNIARTSDPTIWMSGTVMDYTGTQLTVEVSSHQGSGTYSDWTITLSGSVGPQGDPAEFQTSATHIQWRIAGSGGPWQDLVALDDLEGPVGPANQLGIGNVTKDVTADASITGVYPNQVLNLVLPKGDAGDEVELQTTATHIQWRYTGGAWQNLVLLSSLKGDKGDAGDEVELQKTATHIQWRYTGGAWQNLVLLADLKGDKGDAGNDGWSPLTAVVADGSRFVLEITDWTGGAGTKPATGYVGPTGIVATKAEAVDIRGPAGTGDVSSVNSVLPDGNGDVALAIDDIPLPILPNIKPTLLRDFINSKSLGANTLFTRASTATYTDTQGRYVQAGINEPRFTYDPVTGEALGLLLEKQATNLLLNSDIVTGQTVIVPAGNITISFYGSGSVEFSGAASGSLQGAGDNNERSTSTISATAGALVLTVNDGEPIRGQIETGANDSSYIPTEGSQATRAADNFSIVGQRFADALNPNQGALVFKIGEGSQMNYTGSDKPPFYGTALSSGFAINQESFSGVYFSTGVPNRFNHLGVAATGPTRHTVISKDIYAGSTVCISWNGDEIALAVDGDMVQRVTDADLPAAMAGADGLRINPALGIILPYLKMYGRALTDAQMEALTEASQ